MEYTEMLKKAITEMPAAVHERERFEIPKIIGHLEGNKTVVVNLLQINEIFKRQIDHFFKFLLKETAAPGVIKDTRAIFGTKISAAKINEKVRKYAEEFVLCRQCGKPETTLEKEEGVVFLHCQACGAKYPVKTKI